MRGKIHRLSTGGKKRMGCIQLKTEEKNLSLDGRCSLNQATEEQTNGMSTHQSLRKAIRSSMSNWCVDTSTRLSYRRVATRLTTTSSLKLTTNQDGRRQQSL